MATLHGEIGLTSGFLGFSLFFRDGFNNGGQQILAGMMILLFMGRISTLYPSVPASCLHYPYHTLLLLTAP
jgi:hypothetical protein